MNTLSFGFNQVLRNLAMPTLAVAATLGLGTVSTGPAFAQSGGSSSSSSSPAAAYTMTPISSSLPGATVQATGINNQGQVSGYLTIGRVQSAFRWDPNTGMETFTSTIAGLRDAANVVYMASAQGIDEDGALAGSIFADTNSMISQGFLVSPSSTGDQVSPFMFSTSGETWINGIHNGLVVGVDTFSASTLGALWDEQTGTHYLYPVPSGAWSQAQAVNSYRQVVGAMDIGNNEMHPALWARAKGSLEDTFTVLDLGTLGGTDGRANAINDGRRVVGWANTALGAVHAFFWRDSMTDLGVLPGDMQSEALALNRFDQVVGYSAWYSELVSQRAFLWDSVQGMQDLNTLV
ncbi:MAG TPA: hypothetical protein VKU00_04655, partial [Chthonomonadaceae bacterium]|nr:hypothetical protein [Chthonomonadaceae bacterium]